MCIQSNDDNTKLPGSMMARSMAEAQRCELQMGKVFDASCIFSKLTRENEMTTLPLVMLEISMPSVRFCRGGSKHAVIGSVCQSCRCPSSVDRSNRSHISLHFPSATSCAICLPGSTLCERAAHAFKDCLRRVRASFAFTTASIAADVRIGRRPLARLPT